MSTPVISWEQQVLKSLKAISAIESGGSVSGGVTSYATVNHSGAIATANSPQNLVTANPDRDRITIQNLDSTDVLLIGIGEDAQANRSYEIDPRSVGVIEEGEADKRISVLSSKAGLKFVAIARIKS